MTPIVALILRARRAQELFDRRVDVQLSLPIGDGAGK